jgi:hypothetical protein
MSMEKGAPSALPSTEKTSRYPRFPSPKKGTMSAIYASIRYEKMIIGDGWVWQAVYLHSFHARGIMIRRILAGALLALALPVAAQSVPATNYSDMWFLPAESGWGVSFVQHPATNNVYAVWYTYDPREPDASLPGNFRPMWIVMAGGTWTSPTSLTGPVYITNGTPFFQSGSSTRLTQVGTFNFDFQNASNGTFRYNISAPPGIPDTDPAFGLPPTSGTKNITRQSF